MGSISDEALLLTVTAMCSADVETCTNLIKNNKDGRLENI